MNGAAEIFARVFANIGVLPIDNTIQNKKQRIERETHEIAALIHQAHSKVARSVFIGEHYGLETLRALGQFCVVTPQYHLSQANRINNNLLGYVLSWPLPHRLGVSTPTI